MHSCWTEEEERDREIGIKRCMDKEDVEEDVEMERETDKEGETDR